MEEQVRDKKTYYHILIRWIHIMKLISNRNAPGRCLDDPKMTEIDASEFVDFYAKLFRSLKMEQGNALFALKVCD